MKATEANLHWSPFPSLLHPNFYDVPTCPSTVNKHKFFPTLFTTHTLKKKSSSLSSSNSLCPALHFYFLFSMSLPSVFPLEVPRPNTIFYAGSSAWPQYTPTFRQCLLSAPAGDASWVSRPANLTWHPSTGPVLMLGLAPPMKGNRHCSMHCQSNERFHFPGKYPDFQTLLFIWFPYPSSPIFLLKSSQSFVADVFPDFPPTPIPHRCHHSHLCTPRIDLTSLVMGQCMLACAVWLTCASQPDCRLNEGRHPALPFF